MNDCLHCKIQELKQELANLQGIALYWEGQASYWENQYWNKGKTTASERALKRLNGVNAENHPSMKSLENKFRDLK